MNPKARDAYALHVQGSTSSNSRKASSYLRALDLLGPVLAKSDGPFSSVSIVWTIDSIAQLSDLYAYVLDEQKKREDGIFAGHPSPSYAHSGFYSAALRDYRDFLIVHRHEQRLWDVYRTAKGDPHDLGRHLDDQPIEHASLLLEDADGVGGREGRDVLRLAKARINQDFFRKMVLDNYGNRCCLTGIPIPQVLRASHIVSWAEDPSNRLNPANGLCLSATYDAAFDAHLISFDEDYRLLLSPTLRAYVNDEAYVHFFASLERTKLHEATKYKPSEQFMATHRQSLQGEVTSGVVRCAH